MLKYWLLLGPTTTNKTDHKSLWENVVVHEYRNANLPTNEWLEETLTRFMVDNEVSVHDDEPPTLPDVRARCQQMISDGFLHPTTAAQRRRARRHTAGSTYFYPPPMKDPWKWGYTSPNLPNPPGHRWLSSGGNWMLRINLGG